MSFRSYIAILGCESEMKERLSGGDCVEVRKASQLEKRVSWNPAIGDSSVASKGKQGTSNREVISSPCFRLPCPPMSNQNTTNCKELQENMRYERMNPCMLLTDQLGLRITGR